MINKGETKSESCSKIAKELWVLCTHLKICISVAYDESFRESGMLAIDLLASWITLQVERYIS